MNRNKKWIFLLCCGLLFLAIFASTGSKRPNRRARHRVLKLKDSLESIKEELDTQLKHYSSSDKDYLFLLSIIAIYVVFVGMVLCVYKVINQAMDQPYSYSYSFSQTPQQPQNDDIGPIIEDVTNNEPSKKSQSTNLKKPFSLPWNGLFSTTTSVDKIPGIKFPSAVKLLFMNIQAKSSTGLEWIEIKPQNLHVYALHDTKVTMDINKQIEHLNNNKGLDFSNPDNDLSGVLRLIDQINSGKMRVQTDGSLFDIQPVNSSNLSESEPSESEPLPLSKRQDTQKNDRSAKYLFPVKLIKIGDQEQNVLLNTDLTIEEKRENADFSVTIRRKIRGHYVMKDTKMLLDLLKMITVPSLKNWG